MDKYDKRVIVLSIIMALVSVISISFHNSQPEIKEVVKYVEVIATETAPTDQKEGEWQVISVGMFTLTAYCPCNECSEQYDDMTATGVKAQEGRTIAVDPDVIPYGTKVIINGEVYTAEDCGGAIKGNIIDIYFDSHSEVDAFGKRVAEVFILKNAA